jgi:hypothetical protein
MGGKSSSSSQANQMTQTNLNDKRVTNRDGLVLGDGSAVDMSQAFSYSDKSRTDNSVNLSSWDASSTWTDNSMRFDARTNTNTNTNTSSSSWSNADTKNTTGSYNTTVDPTITGQAFDFAKGTDATLGAGLSDILSFAKDITMRASDDTTKLAGMFGQGVTNAYDNSRLTTPGGIDNKTMIVLGVAGAAAVAFMASRKG